MKPYNSSYINKETFLKINRKPDFNNILKVLNREKPDRYTLFEYFMCNEIYEYLTSHIEYDKNDKFEKYIKLIDAYRIAGYDYVTIQGSDFYFMSDRKQEEGNKSISINTGSVIKDRQSFEIYKWPDPESYDYSRLDKLAKYLPEGMKIIVGDADGILEVVIKLVGYDNLCFMIVEEPELVKEIFDNVGSRMVRYHEICAGFDAVGGTIMGDDWGFNSQTMFAPDDLRKFLFPWYKKIVEKIHFAGKRAILHSCGNLSAVFDDIIDDMKFDAKHSYEDKILPVEEAYDKYGPRIAILGGIDLDFLCRSTPKEIYDRAVLLLERSADRGGYALGSGNSIPYYVPRDNYMAMISAVVMNQ